MVLSELIDQYPFLASSEAALEKAGFSGVSELICYK